MRLPSCCVREDVAVSIPVGSAPKVLVALDVNGTILEGDSFYGDVSESLTQPAVAALDELSTPQWAGTALLVYSFGRDFPKVIPFLEQRGYRFPIGNYIFVARALASEEVWAFALTVDGVGKTEHVIFDGDPAITLPDDAAAAVPLLASAADVELPPPSQPLSQPLRFASAEAFGGLVDRLLARGHVVCRAAYDPQHAYFRTRKHGPGKVLASTAVPRIVAFDDNPQDWDLRGGHPLVHVVSPTVAARLNAPSEPPSKDDEKLKAKHAKAALQPSGAYAPTDFVAALRASAASPQPPQASSDEIAVQITSHA